MSESIILELETSEAPAPEAPTEGVLEQNTLHVEEGISRLIELFRNGPRTRAVLTAVLDQAQELEDAVWAVFRAFDPDTAQGQQLDFLGKLVGEPRLGRTDDDYRGAIRVRVLVNQSDGKTEQLLEILQGVFGALDTLPVIHLDEYFPAALVAEVVGDFGGVTIDTVHRLLQQAKAAGVRLDTVFNESIVGQGGLIWAEDDEADLLTGWSDAPLNTHQGGDWSQSL